MKHVLLASLLCFVLSSNAQVTLDSALKSLQAYRVDASQKDTIQDVKINGRLVPALIADDDTLYIADLLNVTISSPRTFEDRSDYLRYMKYRRYAARVYPYAKEAIRIFREAEMVTETMKKRKRKKYLKKLSKELQTEFEEPLKGLSKTQGKILVKMIERELSTSMFELIKMTQGKFKAFYWNQSSKLYGYRLKPGYEKGKNTILDIVLDDFDVSYESAIQ